MSTVVLVPKVRRESGGEGHEEPGHGLIEGRVVEDGAVAEVVHRVTCMSLRKRKAANRLDYHTQIRHIYYVKNWYGPVAEIVHRIASVSLQKETC